MSWFCSKCQMSHKRKVLQGSVANLVRLLLSMFVSLVLPPFLLHHMAPAEYSAWVLILQLSAYVNLLDFGLQTAIGKYVAEYDAIGDREASHHLVSTSFTILAVAATIACAALAAMVWSVPRLFPRCRRGWWATCGSRSLPSDYPLPSRFRSVLFFPPSPVCSDMYSRPSSPQSAAWEPLLSSSSFCLCMAAWSKWRW